VAEKGREVVHINFTIQRACLLRYLLRCNKQEEKFRSIIENKINKRNKSGKRGERERYITKSPRGYSGNSTPSYFTPIVEMAPRTVTSHWLHSGEKAASQLSYFSSESFCNIVFQIRKRENYVTGRKTKLIKLFNPIT